MKKIKNNQGFSLLEVMVVVFIMGLLSTVAVIKLGVGQGTRLESEAKQFADKLQLLMDESILSASNYRIIVDIEKHQYIYQQNIDNWVSLSKKPFETHTMGEGMALLLNATPVEGENKANIIFIEADGVTTSFDLLFGDRSEQGDLNTTKDYWVVTGGYTVSVNRVDASQ